MRHNSRRMKNRSNNNNGGGRRGNNVPPRMQVFDSNGPDVRIRGTAWQVHEKYLALAKDASSSGDLIMAENYLQHAEHYQRIINTFGEQTGQNNNPQQNKSWSPNQSDNDDASQTQSAEKQTAKSDEKEEDLGLPSTLFKSTPSASNADSALETA